MKKIVFNVDTKEFLDSASEKGACGRRFPFNITSWSDEKLEEIERLMIKHNIRYHILDEEWSNAWLHLSDFEAEPPINANMLLTIEPFGFNIPVTETSRERIMTLVAVTDDDTGLREATSNRTFRVTTAHSGLQIICRDLEMSDFYANITVMPEYKRADGYYTLPRKFSQSIADDAIYLTVPVKTAVPFKYRGKWRDLTIFVDENTHDIFAGFWIPDDRIGAEEDAKRFYAVGRIRYELISDLGYLYSGKIIKITDIFIADNIQEGAVGYSMFLTLLRNNFKLVVDYYWPYDWHRGAPELLKLLSKSSGVGIYVDTVDYDTGSTNSKILKHHYIKENPDKKRNKDTAPEDDECQTLLEVLTSADDKDTSATDDKGEASTVLFIAYLDEQSQLE